MAEGDYRTDLKNIAREAIARANPKIYGRVQGNAEAVRQLRTIQDRTNDLMDKVRRHCRKFEESWVAKEAIAVWRKRAVMAAKMPPPEGGVNTALSEDSIMREARQTVQARIARRLTAISRAAAKMENAVIRNIRPVQKPAPKQKDNVVALSPHFNPKRNPSRRM